MSRARSGRGVDSNPPAGLSAWIERVLPGTLVTKVERLDGGATNQVWRLGRRVGGDLVLRLMRRGLPALRRELEARERVVGRIPVPDAMAVGLGSEELGAPWVLDGFLVGARLDLRLGEADPAETHRLGQVVGAAVAGLAVASGERPGAERTPGFLRRTSLETSLGRWLGEDKPRLRLGEGLLDEVRGLMAALGPRTRTGSVLVHGDLKPSNVVVTGPGEDPRVVAVLDWEWASWGDPLADLARVLREIPGATSEILVGDSGPGFGSGVLHGYREAGGRFPVRWRERLALWEMAHWIEAAKADPVPEGIAEAARARIGELVEILEATR